MPGAEGNPEALIARREIRDAADAPDLVAEKAEAAPRQELQIEAEGEVLSSVPAEPRRLDVRAESRLKPIGDRLTLEAEARAVGNALTAASKVDGGRGVREDRLAREVRFEPDGV